MINLPTRICSKELHKFTTNGFFTIRSSDKFWGGIWSDMTIEQVLMRAMKTPDGVTRGRGLSGSSLSRWVLGTPAAVLISQAVESFSGVTAQSSEQHVQLRESRQCRDSRDVQTLIQWLVEHPPFQFESNNLISLSTGVVGGETISCDSAVDCGLKAMKNMIGKTFSNVVLRRKDKVMPLSSANSGVKVRGEYIAINYMQLFHRIVCVVRSDDELIDCLAFELAPRSPSLFDAFSLRKTNKAVLASVLETVVPCEAVVPDGCRFVVDGGYLLHVLVWPQPAKFGELYEAYATYVKRCYGNTAVVVFDGYDATSTSTKIVEQNRRQKKNT